MCGVCFLCFFVVVLFLFVCFLGGGFINLFLFIFLVSYFDFCLFVCLFVVVVVVVLRGYEHFVKLKSSAVSKPLIFNNNFVSFNQVLPWLDFAEVLNFTETLPHTFLMPITKIPVFLLVYFQTRPNFSCLIKFSLIFSSHLAKTSSPGNCGTYFRNGSRNSSVVRTPDS